MKRHVQSWDLRQYMFLVYALVIIGSVVLALVLDFPLIMGLPVALLLGFVAIVDFRKVYILLLMCIPLSTEFYLPGGFSTDLPTEPLIIGLTMVYIYYLFRHFPELDGHFFKHPLMLLLFLHLGWMLVSVINSQLLFVSVKFFIAKLWYVLVFVLLTGLLIKKEEDVRQIFWWMFIPLVLTVIYVLYQQNATGFALKDSHRAMQPFYRNHVVYAALLSLFLPYALFVKNWYQRWSMPWWIIIISIFILLLGIQLSFTRTAYIALIIALGAYFVIRLRLTKIAVGLALVAVLGLLIHLSNNNNYLDYAPNYETTISHYEFNSLLEATYKMEDISTMERLYRWVAAVQMAKEDLATGFGPGNFKNFYQDYSVSSFRTYVSDNPEQSGIHNYYLMMLADQGIPGLIIFLIFTVAIVIKGEQIYHESKSSVRKEIVMMVLLSIIIIDAFLIINDLIETDKVGTLFFINLAILINMDLANRRELG